jgi:hypothetical protein
MKPNRQCCKTANLPGSGQPQHVRTSGRHSASSLLSLALFLALAPAALAGSTWYVDGVNGNDNDSCKSRQTACKTIGHAIPLASSGDSITVAAATYTENLTIGFSLKVIGSDAKTTILDGGSNGSVVMISNSSSRVSLSKLTIRNGLAHDGGGIYNNGTLTISSSTISGNQIHGSTELFAQGAGILNVGTLIINQSTVSRNSAIIGDGGGISNLSIGTVTINNSTISGNKASSVGGAINNTRTLSINNSTIRGNYGFYGGGIRNSGFATLQNSIVADSPSGGNCYGAVTSKGYNLSSDGSCNFNNTGDLNNTDPKLGKLGNYGGPTQTIPLLSGSPAVDAGNPGGCTDGNGHLLKTDQRGKPRPDKEDTGGCDMGAYERQTD